MMDVRPLRNEQDYDWAIGEVSRYFQAEPAPGTPDGDRFEVLSSLIKEYEDNHFATSRGDPVDVLHFAIESMGRSQSELAGLIGRNRASEILNRVRPLTLDMIRIISKEWSIPIDALTAPYELTRAHA
ncbi:MULTISPECIES: type II toxin-antitoxin system HigA family antitoxin [unclassified Bradyrhizobium]|uniref:helix-turn-helix domain-containing protein n=1 Tax=unclassified Bradyrhizobium TaxID=2631580 RepID=UPI0003A80CDB|nr:MULTISPECIES: XRE family transcriptional regulator [unclassified Bradyrhizobium]MBB4258834.1 HTH-type transcriptional regulator/antitoxin HigA [Bradyrhizobium sp. CIR3A]MBB4361565.1 HTH-type transcriptional regulator/antitoxin HigA [Bradyrhizobium sp. CIR18]NYG48548.1 HTH-type transcriptional regulator/antitoxin HigA [Bradyrhizobium sp. IAR9]SFN45963.1 HTH-type transcriptional regulator / antitoxin HigA [Bradyrhizobium sp. Rc3b]